MSLETIRYRCGAHLIQRKNPIIITYILHFTWYIKVIKRFNLTLAN